VPAAAIDRLTCPIGAVGIAGRAPEIIAVAAVAELLRVASAAAPVTSSRDVGARLPAR
jgi:xanthine dehydrogenase accessory factor